MQAFDTHEVHNTVAPLADVNLYLLDTALREAVAREGAQHDDAALASLGAQLGGQKCWNWGGWPISIRHSCCNMMLAGAA